MTTRYAYLATAALALAGIAFTGCKEEPTARTSNTTTTTTPPATTQPSPGEKVSGAIHSAGEAAGSAVNATTRGAGELKDNITAGITPTGANTLDSTRAVVVAIVENALSRNDYGDMVDHFTKSDAQRVTNGKPDTKDLDDLTDAVNNAWKGKFNEKFGFSDKDKVLGPNFMQLSTAPSGGTTGADVNAKQATGKIAESHGMPELDLLFMSEDGKWRLDVPDSMDAKKLHDNLQRALTELQDASKWPADKVEAERAVAHRILLAVEDKM